MYIGGKTTCFRNTVFGYRPCDLLKGLCEENQAIQGSGLFRTRNKCRMLNSEIKKVL